VSRWAFRVTGAVERGSATLPRHWRDDEYADAARLRDAAFGFQSVIELDPKRTRIAPKRLDLVGQLDADTVDSAVQVALGVARWTWVTVYGHPTRDIAGAELPPLAVSVRPCSPETGV
jgi:alkylhydroperoxidase family enzyme